MTIAPELVIIESWFYFQGNTTTGVKPKTTGNKQLCSGGVDRRGTEILTNLCKCNDYENALDSILMIIVKYQNKDRKLLLKAIIYFNKYHQENWVIVATNCPLDSDYLYVSQHSK